MVPVLRKFGNRGGGWVVLSSGFVVKEFATAELTEAVGAIWRTLPFRFMI